MVVIVTRRGLSDPEEVVTLTRSPAFEVHPHPLPHHMQPSSQRPVQTLSSGSGDSALRTPTPPLMLPLPLLLSELE